MKFIADFHIHSHYSIATSKNLSPEYLDFWARVKGIRLIGTGDFTHPGWLKELQDKLEPAEPGLFRLRPEFQLQTDHRINDAEEYSVRFLLTAEISSIYKKGGKVRKVHNLIFCPSFEIVERIQAGLTRLKFNITSDGRPILGLDSRDLLELVLEVSEDSFFVPAHIWTPWFSALGAKSGFDSIQQCYGDLAHHIHAVETGLSSDPAMNWMCSFLDPYTMISNSDAHSPEKLGREANILDTELSYPAIIQTLKAGDPFRFLGTIEFFPQEGKYHYDGHRKCRICWNPLDTLLNDSICTSCGKPVTVGVLSRIAQLSDRNDIDEKRNPVPFYSLVPLKEILSEIHGLGSNSKKVTREYFSLIESFGSELRLLLETPLDAIASIGGPCLAEAVRRIRNREIRIQEGYDGEYGVIRAFKKDELQNFHTCKGLFDIQNSSEDPGISKPLITFDLAEYRKLKDLLQNKSEHQNKEVLSPALFEINQLEKNPLNRPFVMKSDFRSLDNLNPSQFKAASHFHGPALVIAGPGTGKTRVLTQRIVHLIQDRDIPPGEILAVTFTNKAAQEMKERIDSVISLPDSQNYPLVSTFHSFGHLVLLRNIIQLGRSEEFTVINPEDRNFILANILELGASDVVPTARLISMIKQGVEVDEASRSRPEILYYNDYLKRNNLFDLDDLVYEAYLLLNKDEEVLRGIRDQFHWILIDEYQDINPVQYRLMRLLAPKQDSNFFVIGDPDQSIYSFRGSDLRFIQDFLNDYPSAGIYSLDQSYRCSFFILRASECVLATRPVKGTKLEGAEKGLQVHIVDQPTEKSEAEFVARQIENMIGGVRFFSLDSSVATGEKKPGISSFRDFAVLCRISRQMDVFETAFQDHGIPYQRIGEEPFYRKDPARHIINALRFSIHPDSEFLARRLILTGRVFPACSDENVSDQIERIARLFLGPEEWDEETIYRLQRLSEPFKKDTHSFLRAITLGTCGDDFEFQTESVALMTIHAAKGLEFSSVFIPGCEEGLLPFTILKDRAADIDEERRLLYVGMTRAKKYLFLTHCRKRSIMGQKLSPDRSHFLDSIGEGLVELSSVEIFTKTKKKEPQLKLF